MLGLAQLLSSPAPGLRAGLAAGSLARLTAPALASALLQPDAPIVAAPLLLGLAGVLVGTAAAARGTRPPPELVAGLETRPAHAAVATPPSAHRDTADPGSVPSRRAEARSAGVSSDAPPPVSGREADLRPAHAGHARPADGPTDLERRVPGPIGAAVAVGSITGTVARAATGGRWWTVRSTGVRLREGVPYRVVARDGDVLIIAP